MYRDYRRVEGYEDYIISNIGEVWSLKWGKVKLLKPTLNAQGYLTFGLCENGKRTTHQVHALVGIHFIGLRTGEMTYDHIDVNKLNNNADNLRLATRAEQAENQNLRKDNKLGFKNISEKVNRSGNEYYAIEIKRNGKKVQKYFNKKKYCLEYVVSERDRLLENLNSPRVVIPVI